MNQNRIKHLLKAVYDDTDHQVHIGSLLIRFCKLPSLKREEVTEYLTQQISFHLYKGTLRGLIQRTEQALVDLEIKIQNLYTAYSLTESSEVRAQILMSLQDLFKCKYDTRKKMNQIKKYLDL